MKIALLGSAASSVLKAPFKDSRYDAWVQGKSQSIFQAHGQIPGDFDVWACSPGAWAVAPRATRWFEVHRWEPGQPWFSHEYCSFLRDFKGPVYTGAKIPELPNHVVYPIDRIEEKFASYFLTSSLALMMALAIEEIEQVRRARRSHQEAKRDSARLDAGVPTDSSAMRVHHELPRYVDVAELEKNDDDDIIGMWGVDMSASEEWGFQRPGCQFFMLEAMRRGIAVFLPPESELMRPMPVYGISEWDHNYIKLTSRARELNAKAAEAQKQIQEAQSSVASAQGEMHALNHFVNTWTSPYGMQHGLVIRQEPGTGLGSGITHFDGRPVTRMTVEESKPVVQAMGEAADIIQAREFVGALKPYLAPGEHPTVALRRILAEHHHSNDVAKLYAGYGPSSTGPSYKELKKVGLDFEAALCDYTGARPHGTERAPPVRRAKKGR